MVSHADGKHINNNQSKVEKIEATQTNVLSSNHKFLIVKAIPTIHKIKDRTAKRITMVDKPKLGIVSKQNQKIR